ncbi:MAG: hypothetical protein KJ063_18025 [Anaerolineae bacterium]|nr:hypothetical protein [Anaerolineae bacterium]
MKKHRLLLFELISRRMRWKLFWLLMVMIAAAIVDYFTEFLGDLWYLAWVAAGLLLPLWFYYAILFRRGSVQLRPKVLRLQGPLWHLDISYGRIYAATVGQMEQHFAYKKLSWREQAMLRPLYNTSGVFIELKEVPKSYRWRRLWFPKYLFGTRRDGLLLYSGDWMDLSQAIETARGDWADQSGLRGRHQQTSAQRLGLE